ncbi:MAG: YebC/PmpR family DNA-binding transcriptional regulator [Candidatus Sumerlaeota bacterium]|nr:YebC/PmpR family DNA-binding transcriptional regulator [Candidatus Sumerlaeota bacterium]
MSGHNKWSTIKHKKAAVDAKRGRIFTRIIREISIAAKESGGDPNTNPRLRTAISAARAANMPAKNIENAIKKGTGELPGVSYTEVTYEGYGPGGVAIIVHTSTDNTNRTAAEVRHAFAKHNGNLGAIGCVSYLFERKGAIEIEAGKTTEDKLMEIALDAGAEDIESSEDGFSVKTAPADLEKVRAAIAGAGIEIVSAESKLIPKTTTRVEGRQAEQCLKLIAFLDDMDDVQEVAANFDMPDEILEKFGAEN